MSFCTYIYIYILLFICRELKKNKLKRNKQRALPSASWRQRGHVAADYATWAVAVTIWSMLCRQPEGKLTSKGRLVPVSRLKADGKAFAVSSTTTNQLSARQSAVSYFAVSLKSTDDKVFAVSQFGQADGNASRTASTWLNPVASVNGVHCRQLAVWLTTNVSLPSASHQADGKALTKWSLAQPRLHSLLPRVHFAVSLRTAMPLPSASWRQSSLFLSF